MESGTADAAAMMEEVPAVAKLQSAEAEIKKALSLLSNYLVSFLRSSCLPYTYQP
jgi:hypothetical protein